jgi:hypothetical protein
MAESILGYASPKTLLLAIVTVFILLQINKRIQNDRKIRALGGYAASIRYHLPLGELSTGRRHMGL